MRRERARLGTTANVQPRQDVSFHSGAADDIRKQRQDPFDQQKKKATEVFLQRESRFNFYILRCVFCSCLREDSEGQAVDADLDSAGSLVKNIKMADSKANTEHLLKTEWMVSLMMKLHYANQISSWNQLRANVNLKAADESSSRAHSPAFIAALACFTGL
ncbi:hypothetical protein F2P81_011322 [Scophthalmus maximus]|uniref:Uncharacterized protein n=1 Tax=Scophthalmus maximus TaxID=52904 RepID=A0A6A4SVV7_SCOMX|nr:hypothetical protein F2P81_011322 [Scophthalmus maximus]